MNRKHIILSIAVLIIVGTLSFAGTADDPIVTKSYVDALIKSLESRLSGSGTGSDPVDLSGYVKKTDLEKRLAGLETADVDLTDYVKKSEMEALLETDEKPEPEKETVSSPDFILVEISEDSTLEVPLGTEIILLSGKAEVSTIGDISFADTTAGNMMSAGDNAGEAHRLMAASDGALLSISGGSRLMIKGSYTTESGLIEIPKDEIPYTNRSGEKLTPRFM